MIDVQAYLHRIAYEGPLDPTPSTLRALHRAHMLSVPFENLNIHLGRPIILDEALLFEKIVAQRRGGFCYELNGLFAALLRALGFQVTLLSARVARKEGGFGPEFDHLALEVPLDQPYLVDVGFGDSFREPLRLDDPGDQPDFGRIYRITGDEQQLVVLQQEAEGEWREQYAFTRVPRAFDDFAAMCLYHQTSPDTVFIRHQIAALPKANGLINLLDMKLTLTQDGQKEERVLEDEAERLSTLRDLFGLDLREQQPLYSVQQ